MGSLISEGWKVQRFEQVLVTCRQDGYLIWWSSLGTLHSSKNDRNWTGHKKTCFSSKSKWWMEILLLYIEWEGEWNSLFRTIGTKLMAPNQRSYNGKALPMPFRNSGWGSEEPCRQKCRPAGFSQVPLTFSQLHLRNQNYLMLEWIRADRIYHIQRMILSFLKSYFDKGFSVRVAIQNPHRDSLNQNFSRDRTHVFVSFACCKLPEWFFVFRFMHG